MTSPLYYNWSSYPQWGDSGFASAIKTPGEVAPYSFDVSTGYDAEVGRLDDTPRPGLPGGKRAKALSFSNANFCDGAYYFPLFVNGLEIDFSISGSKAQSQMTRDFYPHNMVLPGFNLRGQCYDQTSYGELCEFVHAAQHRAFNNKDFLIQLYVQGSVYPGRQGNRTGKQGVTVNGKLQSNQIIKGQHQPVICLGYIMTMPREHKQGDYAPTWECQFMVANMLSGPYTDGIAYNVRTGNWLNVLTGNGSSATHSQNFTNPANLAENKKNLAWAAKNSANVITQTG
jgi:hypothetical protein